MTDLEWLRALEREATQGKWPLTVNRTSSGICFNVGKFPSNSGVHESTSACLYADNIREDDFGHSRTGDELRANARLIAVARNLLPALLDSLHASECLCAFTLPETRCPMHRAEDAIAAERRRIEGGGE